MTRYGNTGTTTTGKIDVLEMTYNGNQLTKVEDSGITPNLSSSADFRNGANAATEYFYDANGNLVKDLNKGISNISYNSLNLPSKLVISNLSDTTINIYVYTADGQKLSVSKGSFKIDYVGNKIYEKGLNLYDYEARYMDAALGRFTTMDPLAEKYYSISPYGYCAIIR